MFTKILYPTDFSEVSEKALTYVVKLKEAGAQTVVLLHIIDSGNLDVMFHYSPLDVMQTKDRVREMATQKMTALADRLQGKGFDVKIRIEEGTPFSEILRVEEEEQVSSIVIGSHGVSNIKEMLLGSVSEQVIRKAKTPVVVIKREE